MNSKNNPDTEYYPLVSIVTPSYNAMPYIRDNIESVHSQDYPNIEHIVIDGGSSNGTRDLLGTYPHLVWISEPDRGQSHALNKGFRRARGEIIGWLNADDTYRPGAVAHAVLYFQEHPEADIVYTDVQVINENDQPVRLAIGEPFLLETLLFKNIVKQPTVFMRRTVVDQSAGVREDLHYVMDHEFWLLACLSFNLHYIPGTIFANFRFCKGTKSHDRSSAFHREWAKVLDTFQDHPDLDENAQMKVKLAKHRAWRQYYLSRMAQSSNNREYFEMISNFIKALSCERRSLFQGDVWFLLLRALVKPRIRSLDERSTP